MRDNFNALTGLGELIKLIVKRDRVRMSLWVVILGALPMATVQGFNALYDTEAELAQAASGFGQNPAFRAMLGVIYEPSLGGLVAWRASLVPVVVGVIAMMTVIRHTRVEEETGRRELVGAAVVGRHAPLTAAFVVAAVASFACGGVTALGLIAMDLEAVGSIAFGIAIGMGGLMFAGVGALAAQLSESSGGARGIGLAVFALSYVLRAAGDAAGAGSSFGWLAWVSPFGWLGQVRPFAGERWLLLLLVLGVSAALSVAAYRLSVVRDVGGGVFATRSGRPEAGPWLNGSTGLGLRMHRGLVVGWAIGFAVLGLIYGSVANEVGGILDDQPQFREVLERMGGTGLLIDTFIAAAMNLLGLVAAAYAIQATLRLRAEEEAERADLVLSAAVSRTTWVGSHLLYAFVGPAIALFIGGLAAGLAYATVAGDLGQVWRVVGAALVQLPAVWVFAGIVMLLFGWLPDRADWSWGVFGALLIITFFGAILQFPQVVMDLSPFTHVPTIPASPFSFPPVLWLMLVVVAFSATGLLGVLRRDLD